MGSETGLAVASPGVTGVDSGAPGADPVVAGSGCPGWVLGLASLFPGMGFGIPGAGTVAASLGVRGASLTVATPNDLALLSATYR